MAPVQEAVCRIRVKQVASDAQEIQSILGQNDHDNDSIREPLLPLGDTTGIPFETRLQWVQLISNQFLDRSKLEDGCGIRGWDFILGLDGSAVNLASNNASSCSSDPVTKVYPARYRIPAVVIEQLTSSTEKVQRVQLFALGSLLYHLLSGKEMFIGIGEDDGDIESHFIKGEFPEDVWELPKAVRILGCWCPGFAKDLLAAHRANESLVSKLGDHIKKHPILFGFSVLGGVASLASVVALPILGLVGFGAAGPVAGSAAAAWQSSLGIVQAGSLFSWFQSAAMGGAAVGGIWATGLAGAGIAVGAAVAGTLDDVDTAGPDLKKMFLTAWNRDIGETEKQTARL